MVASHRLLDYALGARQSASSCIIDLQGSGELSENTIPEEQIRQASDLIILHLTCLLSFTVPVECVEKASDAQHFRYTRLMVGTSLMSGHVIVSRRACRFTTHSYFIAWWS